MISIDLLSQIHKHKNDVLHQFDSGMYERVKNTLLDRDKKTCQCCGFTSEKHQSIAALNDNVRDLENIITVCIFCQQCFQLERVEEASSGVLIWLPEFTQVELNRLARILFIGAHARKHGYLKFEFFIRELLERKKLCASRLNVTKPLELIELLKNKPSDKVILEDVKAIRLFPTQKLIRKQGTLAYNQFPSILAFWKMDAALEKEDLSILKKLEELFFNEEKFERFIEENTVTEETTSSVSSDEPTLAELSCKLLKDAAGFFKTLAEQNLEVEKEMKENASVFEQMAELLLQNPLGAINDKTHAELAGRLLSDAADFFNTLAEQNESIREQMRENANVFKQIATLVAKNPLGHLPGDGEHTEKTRDATMDTSSTPEEPTIAQVASQLLQDTAAFFITTAKENPEIEGDMKENAKIFGQMAQLLKKDPLGVINGKTHTELATKLLKDATALFQGAEMEENANLLSQMAALLEQNPLGHLPRKDLTTTQDILADRKALRILKVAVTLLVYASDLFVELAGKGIGEKQEMMDYAKAFRILAELLQEAPIEKIGNKTHIEVTIHLMKDFIKFLESLGLNNSTIQNWIKENLWVFKHIINLLENDPFGYI